MIRRAWYWARVREMIQIVLALLGLTLIARAVSGCQSVAAATGYTAAHLRCVDSASTREQSQACRERVRAQWGQLDGGARE